MAAPDDAVTAERLFAEAFLPLYPSDAAADLAQARRTDANPGKNPALLAHLEDAATRFAALAPRVLSRRADELDLDFSDASVHRLGGALAGARGRDLRDAWRAEPTYGAAEGTLFNVVVHGAAYVGECIRKNHGGEWLVRRPAWESQLRLRSAAGEADLAPFHFWLKALADDALAGRAASLADRYRALVEAPTEDVDTWPVFLRGERRAPPLKKPRYDALYKYMRAHFPELRDLGVDFPSPERWDEMALRWLEAHVLGGGRRLLLGGAGRGGVHLFWLDGAGFSKAAFVPADDFPEPRLTITSERVRVDVRRDGQDAFYEVLWRGP